MMLTLRIIPSILKTSPRLLLIKGDAPAKQAQGVEHFDLWEWCVKEVI